MEYEVINAKKLILHIGSGKTGTTSIQSYLSKKYPQLKADRVLYPKTTRMHADGRLDTAHHQLCAALTEGKGSLTQSLDIILNQIANEMRQGQCEVLLLSSENFMDLRRPEILCRYFNVDEVQIVATFRNQGESMSSAYYTDVCHRKVIDMPMTYLDNFNGNLLDYAGRMSAWRAAWPEALLSVTLFERGTLARDFPVANLLKQIRLNWELTSQDNVVEHRSLPAQATLFLRQLAASGWSDEAFFDIFTMCHRNRSWFSPITSYFSPAVMQQIVDDYALQNKALAENFISDGPLEFSPLRLPDADEWNAAMGDPAAVFPTILKRISRQAVAALQ